MTQNNDVVATPEDDKAESTVDSTKITKLKGQLRAQAERIVVQRHQDEYHEEASKLFAEHGLEFTRRLSPKEKAEKELKELLTAHPELAEKINTVSGRADKINAVPGRDEQDQSAPDDSFKPF